MILIDVRTVEEYAEGHVKGAESFPLQDILSGKGIGYEKDDEIGLYCRSGGRSETALHILKQQGYSNVVNIGGLEDAVTLIQQS